MFIDGVFALAQQKAGKLRMLATTSAKIAGAPDVPTMREAGVGNYGFAVWWMIMTPAGTPAGGRQQAQRRLHQDCRHAGDEDIPQQRGVFPLKGTPAEMVVKLEKDIKTWAEIAKAGNIVPQ